MAAKNCSVLFTGITKYGKICRSSIISAKYFSITTGKNNENPTTTQISYYNSDDINNYNLNNNKQINAITTMNTNITTMNTNINSSNSAINSSNSAINSSNSENVKKLVAYYNEEGDNIKVDDKTIYNTINNGNISLEHSVENLTKYYYNQPIVTNKDEKNTSSVIEPYFYPQLVANIFSIIISFAIITEII